jgi:Na+-transporting NADH:ubiquinone oxidoreductase subunit NqrE
MTFMRYWLYCMLLALGGGFLILESQSFASTDLVRVGLGVSIAAAVISLAALDEASKRSRRVPQMLAVASFVIAGLTVVGTAGIAGPATEKWFAFAGGAGILALALASLTVHEITTERVVHGFEIGDHQRETEDSADGEPAAGDKRSLASRVRASRPKILTGVRVPMRHWIYSMLLGLAGGFLVLETRAFSGTTITSIGLGVAIGATVISLAALYEARKDRTLYKVLAGTSLVAAGWTVVALTGIFGAFTEKWLAFAGGVAILAIALVSLFSHEIFSERVVHELEVREREIERKPASPTS